MPNTRKIVGLSLLTAIVAVLQFLGSFVRFGPFSISLVLIPIVVGAALYGVGAGAWLGAVFAATVFLSGDANVFLAVSPLATIGVVVLKGILAGLIAGIIYKALEAKNQTSAAVCAAVLCPIINTGIFYLGCRYFFFDIVKGWAEASGLLSSSKTFFSMFFGVIGGNFCIEMIINVVLSPVIVRLINIGRQKHIS